MEAAGLWFPAAGAMSREDTNIVMGDSTAHAL
jgi:hypothetical protein